MANQTLIPCKPLNPYAPPYPQTPPHFYIYVFPYNAIPTPALHPPFSTYYIHLQPPSPPPAKKIVFSLTHLPSGPRNPKPSSKGRRIRHTDAKKTKWLPKFPEKVDEKLVFGGKRWKNTRNGYQKSLPLETDTTSLMIKNIPNKYTRKLLIQTLDNHCEAENRKIEGDGVMSAYDFVYLPIDFNQRANAGFAFVNFTSAEAALRFRDAFDGKRWNMFESSKVAEISRARIQGKVASIRNCEAMSFAFGSVEDMPVWFSPARDGVGSVGSKMFTVGRF